MLIDELKALADRALVEGCVVGIWVKQQDVEFQNIFQVLRERPNLNLTEALNLIKQYHPDIPFKRTSFVHHVKGACTCPTA